MYRENRFSIFNFHIKWMLINPTRVRIFEVEKKISKKKRVSDPHPFHNICDIIITKISLKKVKSVPFYPYFTRDHWSNNSLVVEKKSSFPLIVLTGILLSWIAFELSNIFISLKKTLEMKWKKTCRVFMLLF